MGEGRRHMTCLTTDDRYEYVKARADGLGWSVSQFTGQIIEEWLETGAPLLDKHDKPLPLPKFTVRHRWMRVSKKNYTP